MLQDLDDTLAPRGSGTGVAGAAVALAGGVFRKGQGKDSVFTPPLIFSINSQGWIGRATDGKQHKQKGKGGEASDQNRTLFSSL